MSPFKDKTAPGADPFTSPTVIGGSPFGVKTEIGGPQNLDLEATLPGELAALRETLPGGGIPRGVDRLDVLIERVEALMKHSRDITDDSVDRGLNRHTLLLDQLLARIDKLLGDTNATAMGIDNLVRLVDTDRKETIEEARSVARGYKGLLDKMSAEREGLARELEAARNQVAAEQQRQTQALTELQRTFDRERKAADERVQTAHNDLTRSDERVRELEQQLREALASRDRIASRVSEIEAKLEGTVFPMRQEVEAAHMREAQLKSQLEAARREIATLRVVVPH